MSALALQQMPEYDAPADTDVDEFDPSMVPAPVEAEPQRDPQVLRLEEIAEKGVDLAFVLQDDALNKIAQQCVEGYERDKVEREEWEQDWEAIMSLARGERETKDFPWPGAANVKYPLILTAALQFGSRAYPAVVKGQEVARVRTIGEDPTGEKRARADRVAEHQNWQLLEDMPEWEEDTDKLLHMLPFHGCIFRQMVWDPTYTRPKTSLVSAKSLVMTQAAKDLETIPLFCKEFELFPHEITERMRDGRYVETELNMDGEHKQAEQAMLECHCRYDLDDDEYDEPYIAVIHKASSKVLSLKAGFWPSGVMRERTREDMMMNQPGSGRVVCVKRHVEFIKYGFLPNFEGKFLDIGFGFLLREHNTIINSIINQLLDAATDQNAGGGFIGKGVNLKGGRLEWEPGEWKMVNVAGGTLRENMVERKTSEPSPTLFQLLGLMIEAGKELAQIRDVMTGEIKQNMQPTTVLALIEQGLQVFSAIYKRIYRALGKELNLLYTLNGAYLPEQAYNYVLDTPKAIARADYAAGDYDIRPVSDPSKTTSAQRLAKAQFLDAFKGDPDVDQRELKLRQFEAAEIDDVDKLLPKKEDDPTQKLLAIRGMLAEIRKNEATADEKEASAKLKDIQAAVEAMTAMLDTATTIANIESIRLGEPNGGATPAAGQAQVPAQPGQPSPMGGMAGAPPDAGVPQMPQAPFGGNGGGMEGTGIPGSGNPGGFGAPAGPVGPPFDVDELRGAERPLVGNPGGVAGV